MSAVDVAFAKGIRRLGADPVFRAQLVEEGLLCTCEKPMLRRWVRKGIPVIFCMACECYGRLQPVPNA